jgi:small subunit ribosomal protein S6e
MAFKFNVSSKDGKTYHFESESESIDGKELNQKILGQEIYPDLAGYEFEITGMSDNSGLTSLSSVDGVGLKRVLLSYGKGMHGKSRKEGKKFRSNMKPNGMRRRKTSRGKVISPNIAQINLKILKEGGKKLAEIWPEQCLPKAKEEVKK